MGLINPDHFPSSAFPFFVKNKQPSTLHYVFKRCYSFCRSTASLYNNFKMAIALKVHRMWTVRRLHKKVWKSITSTFWSMIKKHYYDFPLVGCQAPWTREIRDQFYIWIGSAAEAWGSMRHSGWRDNWQV